MTSAIRHVATIRLETEPADSAGTRQLRPRDLRRCAARMCNHRRTVSRSWFTPQCRVTPSSSSSSTVAPSRSASSARMSGGKSRASRAAVSKSPTARAPSITPGQVLTRLRQLVRHRGIAPLRLGNLSSHLTDIGLQCVTLFAHRLTPFRCSPFMAGTLPHAPVTGIGPRRGHSASVRPAVVHWRAGERVTPCASVVGLGTRRPPAVGASCSTGVLLSSSGTGTGPSKRVEGVGVGVSFGGASSVTSAVRSGRSGSTFWIWIWRRHRRLDLGAVESGVGMISGSGGYALYVRLTTYDPACTLQCPRQLDFCMSSCWTSGSCAACLDSLLGAQPGDIRHHR